jgi:hypothetical protein
MVHAAKKIKTKTTTTAKLKTGDRFGNSAPRHPPRSSRTAEWSGTEIPRRFVVVVVVVIVVVIEH